MSGGRAGGGLQLLLAAAVIVPGSAFITVELSRDGCDSTSSLHAPFNAVDRLHRVAASSVSKGSLIRSPPLELTQLRRALPSRSASRLH